MKVRDSSRRRFLIVGGGCYGSHYAQALTRARDRGECAENEAWVIDRDPGCAASRLLSGSDTRLVVEDWDDFLSRHLARWQEGPVAGEKDSLVPAPLTPHLFSRWIQREMSAEANVEEIEPPFLPETPFARISGARLVVSFAEWRCPTHCVEPFVCPATRQIKTWDVARELGAYVRRLRGAGWDPVLEPLVARVTHRAEGVGGFPLRDWARAGRKLRAALSRRGRTRIYALVATVSSCHGAASFLQFTRREKEERKLTDPGSRERARGKAPESARDPNTTST
jgi:hypothetical protein